MQWRFITNSPQFPSLSIFSNLIIPSPEDRILIIHNLSTITRRPKKELIL